MEWQTQICLCRRQTKGTRERDFGGCRDARLPVVVDPGGGDEREQIHQVPSRTQYPAPFRTRDTMGRLALDFRAVLPRVG